MHYSQLLQFALNKPKTIYAIVITMVLISLAMIPQLTIDTDPENMLSSQNSERVFHNNIKKTFNMPDMIVVGIVSENSIYQPKTLAILQQLSDKILQIEGVITQDLLSLSVVDNITQEKNGGIRFEYLMQQAPKDLAGSEKIAEAVKRLPLLANTLVSGDDKAAAIYVPITAKDLSYSIAEQIREINQTFTHHDLTFHITGLPIAEDQFGYEMFVQMGIAAPLAGLAIFVLLWYFFRNFPLIIAPMAVAMATVIIIMGALIGLGFTVHIMTSMIAIFLMPIAVVDSVHILSEFSDRYKEGDDTKQVIKKVMSHLFTPMLFTSITSAVGFYSLLLTPIPPVKIFGAFIGTGILLAFLLTVIYLPVYLSRLSPKSLANLQLAVAKMEEKGRLSNSLLWLGNLATKKAKAIIFSFIVIFIFSLVGINKIIINDNPVNWFKADHEIRIADKVLNEHFAGTYDAWLVFSQPQKDVQQAELTFMQLIADANQQGIDLSTIQEHLAQWKSSTDKGIFSQELLIKLDDLAFSVAMEHQAAIDKLYQFADQQFAQQKLFIQPEMLNWLADLQTALNNTALVGKTNGLSDIVRTVNRELHSGNALDFVIPKTSNGVAQTLLQYQSSHRPNDLWHFVSQDYQQSLIWLQMTSGDNQHTTAVVEWVNQYVQQNPPPIDVEMNWAGKSYLNIVWQDAMVNGMLNSLLSSFVIVFLMMALLFRSIKYGVLAMLPLTLTISLIYGLIGWLGKAYDMPIAVLSALTLGLSIDFAIHFLQRVRELEKQTNSLTKALLLMFEEPSRAISRNAIVIAIGFTPLLLSPLMPYITVGFFLASIMIVSALVTLLLLPALLSLFSKDQTTNNQA
ncbi:MMPL family transporter [Thalassotalea sp. SU-HH00458]|uniref:efflux RND transporter permease subunit n=1 Tax=Thalassotalea sp. SU-HH00458 TaxID=3127657 RepID=UPI003103228E